MHCSRKGGLVIRDRLEELSAEALLKLAARYDVEELPEDGREALIDQIIEAIEERYLEKQATDNSPIRIEELKYELLQDGTILEGLEAEDEFAIPERYNETRIVLLLRDPAWAYAYWDIREPHVDEAAETANIEQLLLTVYELRDPSDSNSRAVQSIDIPVQVTDNRWYINLPQQGTYYRIDLKSIDSDEQVSVLATSNTIMVPRGGVADQAGEEIDSRTDKIVAYAYVGLQKLGVSTYGSPVPQRIISLIDEQD